MPPHSLKQQIADSSKVPSLPHLACEALCATEDDRAALLELTAMASFDSELAEAILAEAPGRDHALTLEEAVIALGLCRLRKVLFRAFFVSSVV